METKLPPELEEKIDAAQSLDDVVRIYAEAGISVSKEQLEAISLSDAGDELSEGALDAVSGGSLWLAWVLYQRYKSRHSGGGHRF